MSHRPVRLFLQDIRDRIGRIERYVRGLDRAGFLQDLKTCDSVVRNLEVIGEAAARLPENFRRRHPDVPWRRMVGLRNRIVHAYFDVDLELVWEIVAAELPPLKAKISALIAEGEPADDRGDA